MKCKLQEILLNIIVTKIFFRIKISFNVNHSVDTDMEPEITDKMDKPDVGELKSKPAFKVDLVRGNTTISLFCSFINTQDQDENYSRLILFRKVWMFQIIFFR